MSAAVAIAKNAGASWHALRAKRAREEEAAKAVEKPAEIPPAPPAGATEPKPQKRGR